MDKKEKVKEPVKVKEYFTVKLEVVAPATVTYRVFAETPEEAAEIALKLKGRQLTSPPTISWNRLRTLKAVVYTAGSSLIRLAKNM